MNRLIPVAIVAIVLIAGGGWWLTQSGNSTNALPAGAAGAEETREDVDTSGVTEMVLGSEDAPIEIVEYASYTCPHCATFHENQFKKLKTDYIDTGKVKFTYREVYFDRYGLWASMIARCGGPERFFGITDLIFKGQSEWVRAGEPALIVEELRKIGRLAGLDNDQLETCLQDGEKAQALVAWYEKNAEADNVTGTPSFVIDGEMHSNMSYAEFQTLLDGKLNAE